MFETPRDARVSHCSERRLRIKIPSKRKDETFFGFLQSQLASINGVESVEVNPSTASILVIHSTSRDTILNFAREHNLFSLENVRGNSPHFHRGVEQAYGALDRQVKGFLGGGLNLGALVSVVLAGMGIYQISRGNFGAIPWYSAFWYSLGIFLRSRPAGDGGGE